MPRKSPEAVAAAAWRASTRRQPPPPVDLDAEAGELWRQIVADRPDEWFTPAALGLLRRFCRTLRLAERLHDALDEASDLASPAALQLQRGLLAATNSAAILAARLRLTPQSTLRRGQAVLAQRAPPRDPLLGGRLGGTKR
jgi:hypothetical protein